jgi:GTPase SAR1 family protein
LIHAVRILVLGDSNVGKSTLVALLSLYHQSQPTTQLPHTKPTWGCQTTLFQYRSAWIEVLEVGGKSRHPKSIAPFLDKYHGLLLLFDVTQPSTLLSLERFEHMFDVPVLIIGNKSDLYFFGFDNHRVFQRWQDKIVLQVSKIDQSCHQIDFRFLNAFLDQVVSRKSKKEHVQLFL